MFGPAGVSQAQCQQVFRAHPPILIHGNSVHPSSSDRLQTSWSTPSSPTQLASVFLKPDTGSARFSSDKRAHLPCLYSWPGYVVQCIGSKAELTHIATTKDEQLFRRLRDG